MLLCSAINQRFRNYFLFSFGPQTKNITTKWHICLLVNGWGRTGEISVILGKNSRISCKGWVELWSMSFWIQEKGFRYCGHFWLPGETIIGTNARQMQRRIEPMWQNSKVQHSPKLKLPKLNLTNVLIGGAGVHLWPSKVLIPSPPPLPANSLSPLGQNGRGWRCRVCSRGRKEGGGALPGRTLASPARGEALCLHPFSNPTQTPSNVSVNVSHRQTMVPPGGLIYNPLWMPWINSNLRLSKLDIYVASFTNVLC